MEISRVQKSANGKSLYRCDQNQGWICCTGIGSGHRDIVLALAGKDNAEVVMTFKTAAIGAKLLMPPIDQLEQINALKDFVITLEGPEEEATWFTQTIVRTQSIGWKYGVDQGNGVTRYTQMTNGGPIFAYVKDDKIIRITPIEFDETDPSHGPSGRGGRVHPTPQDHTGAAWYELEEHGLFA